MFELVRVVICELISRFSFDSFSNFYGIDVV